MLNAIYLRLTHKLKKEKMRLKIFKKADENCSYNYQSDTGYEQFLH